MGDCLFAQFPTKPPFINLKNIENLARIYEWNDLFWNVEVATKMLTDENYDIYDI